MSAIYSELAAMQRNILHRRRREYSGPVYEQIEQAFQFVLRNIHLGAEFDGLYRRDVYEIPPEVIRELIINAAVHRSYLDHNNIQVAVYDDRLEVTSPGKLPMGQNLRRMKEGYSRIRNEALAYVLAYMHLIYIRMNPEIRYRRLWCWNRWW